MQANRSPLHPLLTVAAISVTVASAIGAATLVGLIPSSRGEPSALELPKELVKPLAPAISHPVTQPAPRKTQVRRAVPKPVEPATQTPAVEPMQTRTAQVSETPKPAAPVGQLATVESVREVKEPGDAKGVGAVAGGVVGGLLAHKLGKGKGLVTVLGAAGGAFGGHQIEKHARATKHWELALRLDDGSVRTLSSETAPGWRAGDRVRVVNDQLTAA